jgi:TatD DNase family protein
MKLGIGGVVTLKWKNRSVLNQIDLKDIVLDRLALLSSSSFRGKRNESSYLLNVIDKLAIIYNLTAKINYYYRKF